MVGDFITGLVVVPLAHDLFGVRVVQCGEVVVGQLAHQVFLTVDFKGVEVEVAVCVHVVVVCCCYYYSSMFLNGINFFIFFIN